MASTDSPEACRQWRWCFSARFSTAFLGHKDVSAYLLLPHYANGPAWAMLAFSMIGCLASYLWYNCNPSVVLMGDAGSRPIGLLLGVLVLASGNPFLVLVVATVVLVNGGTGLLKVALLRFFRIPIFRKRSLSTARPHAQEPRMVEHAGARALHAAAGSRHSVAVDAPAEAALTIQPSPNTSFDMMLR